MNARDPEAEAEAVVARLLAEAGGPVPMPPDVAARLDDVLAGLERERAGAPAAAASDDVVELRTRRRWPRLLLAAAAVVVGGYSMGTVLTQGTLSGSDSDMSAGAESAVTDGSGGRSDLRRNSDRDGAVAQDEEGANDKGGAGPLESAPESSQAQGSFLHLDRPVALRSDELETGVRRALRLLERPLPATADLRGGDALKRAQERCPGPAPDRGDRSLLVRYDGERAVLVAGPERKGRVEVTVFSCSGSELVTTLVRR